jgi:hypothetical protein
MNTQPKQTPIFVRLLNVVKVYYFECSEGTQKNFSKLGKALAFTVIVCGSIFAASFCEFWLGRNYMWMPLVFIGTGLFYYILDQAIIMGDSNKNYAFYKKLRVFIALVLGLFNSLLIDYYFFKSDIAAARETEITVSQNKIDADYASLIKAKNDRKTVVFGDIDRMESLLAADLDSLDAEATGNGGTRKRGVATVWQAKYQSYHADSLRFSEAIANKRKEVNQLDGDVATLTTERDGKKEEVPGTVSQGINKSLELLHHVIFVDGKFTNILMSILILIVSMLMELIPLFTKGFYDISEYFDVTKDKKEACAANSNIKKQNYISQEATRLMHENAQDLAVQLSEHRIGIMNEDINHSRKIMKQTEGFMDDIEKTENRWKEKYPALYDRYGKPVIEKAYLTLSAVTEKAYS